MPELVEVCPGSDRTTWDTWRMEDGKHVAMCNYCHEWVSIEDPQYRLDKHDRRTFVRDSPRLT